MSTEKNVAHFRNVNYKTNYFFLYYDDPKCTHITVLYLQQLYEFLVVLFPAVALICIFLQMLFFSADNSGLQILLSQAMTPEARENVRVRRKYQK